MHEKGGEEEIEEDKSHDSHKSTLNYLIDVRD